MNRAKRTVLIPESSAVDRDRAARILPLREMKSGKFEARLPIVVRIDEWRKIQEALAPHLHGPPSAFGIHEYEPDAGPPNVDVIERFVERHLEDGYDVWMDARARKTRINASVITHGRIAFVDEPGVEAYFPKSADSGPPLDLIVRIASECSALVKSICNRPRSVLKRRRVRQKIDRVQQVDAGCIRWLASQPGRTIAEKAGPAQRILGIVREQSIDTLENRVLNDFLRRCIRTATAYIRRHEADAWDSGTGHEYIQATSAFQRVCETLIARTPIGDLATPKGPVAPNYALQFDRRYATLWRWYEQLVRREDQIATAVPWFERLLAERTMFELAQRLRATLGSSVTSVVQITEEHRFGRLLPTSSGFALGPFKSKDGEIRVLDLMLGSDLIATGIESDIPATSDSDIVLHAHSPFDSTDDSVLILRATVPAEDLASASPFPGDLVQLETYAFERLQGRLALQPIQELTHAVAVPNFSSEAEARVAKWLERFQ